MLCNENPAIVVGFNEGFADEQIANEKKVQNALVSKAPLCKGSCRAKARLRDCFYGNLSFTTPPSFSCENATSPYTGEAYSETRLRVASVNCVAGRSIYNALVRSQ